MVKGKAMFSAGIIAAAAISAAWADSPGRHPGYLHALSDLRAARWFLTHQPGDARVNENEKKALGEVDLAIGEINKASIDDGKPLSDHPNVDVSEEGSRLLRALETLHKAQDDIRGEEESPEVKGLRARANHHIDLAIQFANGAHDDWVRDKKK
jgi:hypothetical protein